MDVFVLLAEPVRFRIIEILATGEHTSGQIADVLHHEFGVSWPAASQHLRLLRAQGFLVRRAQGAFRFYRLAPDALDQLDRAVDRLHDLWDARYGWPYRADPLAVERFAAPRRRLAGRGRRGRSTRPVVADVSDDNDPWQWLGD